MGRVVVSSAFGISRLLVGVACVGLAPAYGNFGHAAPSRLAQKVGGRQSALTDRNYALDPNPDLANPERGVAYRVGSSGSDAHTLKFHFLWLGNSCNSALTWQGRAHAATSQVLKDWANAAITARDAGKKLIFRPRYDMPGAEGVPNTCGKVEGASYAQMQNHVQAIAAMLADQEIRPTVAFLEMGYLGSWGEWNVKREICGADVNACRPYAPVLLAAAPGSDRLQFTKYVIDTYRGAGMTRAVGLRRPEFFKDAEYNLGVASTAMGFYNDCLMSSSSDSGTFTRIRWDFTNYTDLYPNSVLPDVASAKSYMQSKAGDGTQGGETCPNGQNTEEWRTNPGNVPIRLNADSYLYLHGGWATDFRQTMIDANQWDTIKSRLGYRYQVTEVTYPPSVAPNLPVTIDVRVTNSGFARIPYERTAYIVLRGPVSYVVGSTNPKSETYARLAPSAQSNQSVRSWSKGASTLFSQTFPAPPVSGTYRVHVYVPDTDCVNNPSCSDALESSYAVRLATTRGGTNLFDSSTGTNDLGVSITVSGGGTGCASAGNLVQNCDFSSGTSAWHCGVSGTAAASCSVTGAVHRTVITSPGAFAYSVQPNQGNLALANGATYTVSFDARASIANRPIAVSITMNHDSYSSYSGVRSFTLGTSFESKSFSFTMTDPSDVNAKIEFDLGANGTNTVFLDNVVVKPAG